MKLIYTIFFTLLFSTLPLFSKNHSLLEEANNLYYMQNKKEASFSYYEKAMAQGDVLAQIQLGKMYYLGLGVKEDRQKGFILIKDGLNGLQERVIAKDAFAQYLYAYLSDEGIYFDRNKQIAQRYYKKAAENGNIPAQNNLGGLAVDEQRYEEAIKWYKLAAASGSSLALYNLGVQYENGQGVPQDLAEAKRLYIEAANLNNSYAKESLERLERQERETRKQREHEQAIQGIIATINDFYYPHIHQCQAPSYPSIKQSQTDKYFKQANRYRDCLIDKYNETLNAKKFLFDKLTVKNSDGRFKPLYPELYEPLKNKLQEGENALSMIEDKIHAIEEQADEVNADIKSRNHRVEQENSYKSYNYNYPKYQFIPPKQSYVLPGMP